MTDTSTEAVERLAAQATSEAWEVDVAATLRAVAAERDELRAREQRRWDATQRGIKAWQDKHPDRARSWPDFADMVTWLLEERDRLAAEVAKLRAELQNVLEWSLVEKAPLRAQEIKSIRAALAGDTP
jgi:hypothetical protein